MFLSGSSFKLGVLSTEGLVTEATKGVSFAWELTAGASVQAPTHLSSSVMSPHSTVSVALQDGSASQASHECHLATLPGDAEEDQF